MIALPGQSYYNLVEARRYLLDQTGRDVIEPLLIDWIGQGRVTASIQVEGLWLSRKGPWMQGVLEGEHRHSGIVDVDVSEHQAQRMKVDPYAKVGAETVSVGGHLWQTDSGPAGHGCPLTFDATCLLIRAADLERLAGELRAKAGVENSEPGIDSVANTPWNLRVQIEATKRAKDFLERGAVPKKNSLAPGLVEWCRDNNVKPHSGIYPSEQTIRKVALKGWEPPES
jgi:hypothetical protein